MKLHTLQVQNLRQHADTAVEFPAEGITGIVGANESGKSTLLEAVAWALFGSKALRGTKNSLRWNRAPARHVAGADLEFEVGGTRYRVERTETDAKLFEAGDVATPIAEGTSAVDEYIPGLLGMTLKEYEATYLCAQKDLGRLASMGPTERQAFVRGVMGLDRIDDALAEVRARKNELAREAGGREAGLGQREPLEQELAEADADVKRLTTEAMDLKERVGALDDDYQAVAGRLLTLDQRKERHDHLTAEAEAAGREIDRLKEDLRQARQDLEERSRAETRVRDAEPKLAQLPGFREERDQLIAARERAGQRGQLQETIVRLEEDVAGLGVDLATAEATIEGHDEEALEAVAARYTEMRDRYRETVKARGTEAAEAKAARESANRRAREIREQVATLREAGSDGACPTCTRPLHDVWDATVAALEDQAAHFDDEAKAAATAELAAMDPSEEEQRLGQEVDDLRHRGEQLSEARTRAREAERQAENLRMRIQQKENELGRRREQLAAMEATEFSAEDLRNLESMIADLEKLEAQIAAERATVKRLAGTEGRIRALEDEMATARAHHGKTVDALSALAYDPDEHAETRERAAELRDQREGTRMEHRAVQERGRAALDRQNRLRLRLADYDERAQGLRDLREELRVHTAAAERLDAFRVEQASLIRPELEELTSGFVAILTDGRHDSVTVTEAFEVVLQEAGLDTEVVSGGTEDLSALALRLAMSQMIAERAGHPLSLLVLDEPFGSLDQTRRQNVLSLIRRLSSTFEQVITISHVEETRDAVDHVVELGYDEAAGQSRVVGVAPAAEAEAVEAAA